MPFPLEKLYREFGQNVLDSALPFCYITANKDVDADEYAFYGFQRVCWSGGRQTITNTLNGLPSCGIERCDDLQVTQVNSTGNRPRYRG
jgi:hypothetical protein